MTRIASLSIPELREALAGAGLSRALFHHDPAAGGLRASHPLLEPLAAEMAADARDFDEHEAIFLEIAPETRALFGAFLHRTRRGQGAGGVRHWPYESVREFVRDGLRLSRGMGRKNALAGLWWGGGKGIIARTEGDGYRRPEYRRRLYQEYGRFITSLRGCYVTAEDAGTTAADMADVFATTRFVTCVPPEVGGSGNPSGATARGVVCAMEAAVAHLGMGTLSGKRVAMQGTGNVGSAMIQLLLERGVAHVVAAEISPEQQRRLATELRGRPVDVELVTPDDTSIFTRDCDLFVPNALGGILSPATIPLLRARIVCGAANNQLLDDRRDDKALRARGILHVPDFVANRMGIVQCANEQYGVLPQDPAIERHFDPAWEHSVFAVTRRVLARADAGGMTPTEAANGLADDLARALHPIWGHRGRELIGSLVRDGWYLGPRAGSPAAH